MEDKFAELKEAYKNGARIQIKGSFSWNNIHPNTPSWIETEEYRVDPNYNPEDNSFNLKALAVEMAKELILIEHILDDHDIYWLDVDVDILKKAKAILEKEGE